MYNRRIMALINKVKKVDLEAGKWLFDNLQSLSSFQRVADIELNEYIDVSGLFVWTDTPQGSSYWSNIDKRVNELGETKLTIDLPDELFRM